jgi:hypothetical protein
MAYLGLNYRDQLSTLTNRLTLHYQKELSINSFSETTFTYKRVEYSVLGATFRGINPTLDIIQSVTEDLDCIQINQRDSCSDYICLVVGKIESVQAWYDMMRAGDISLRVVRKFNLCAGSSARPLGFSLEEWEAQMDAYEAELENIVPRYFANKYAMSA